MVPKKRRMARCQEPGAAIREANMQDLICYVFDGWHPLLRPAPQERDWMDKTNDTYAYRCLPLSIANTHGWQLLCYCDFEVWWTGGPKLDDLRIRILTPDVPLGLQPSSVFGPVHVLAFEIIFLPSVGFMRAGRDLLFGPKSIA